MTLSILRRAMELEVEGRRLVGRPKKALSKVVKKDIRKLNITEDMAEDRKQWRQLISHPRKMNMKMKMMKIMMMMMRIMMMMMMINIYIIIFFLF